MAHSEPALAAVPTGRALLAGAAGALLVGVAETAWVSRLGDLEPGTWSFALALHGLLGACVGLGVAVACNLLTRWSPARFRAVFGSNEGGWLVALTLLPLGLPTLVFRVRRDLLAEGSMPLWVPLLCLLAVVAVLLLWLALGRLAGGKGQRLNLALVLPAALVALAPGGQEREEIRPLKGDAAVGPDIVLVLADTLRADALGSYSTGARNTPALDELAAGSIRFANSASQASWTRASIASLFSGLYPSGHRAEGKSDSLPEDAQTLAEVLQEAGYSTGALVNNPNVTQLFGFQQGFDSFHYLQPKFFLGATPSGAQLTVYNLLRVLRERLLPPSKDVHRYYIPGDEVTEAALQVLQGPAGGRFLFVHYMDPHDPYFGEGGELVARVVTPRPEPGAADALRALYAEEVGRLDQAMGKLLGGLESQGALEGAVLLFTSDHGEEFFEHAGWWHGTTLYQEQIHVPLLLKLPRGAGAGTVREDAVRTLDIPVTLAELGGATPPESWMGQSLLADAEARGHVFQFAEERFEGNELESLAAPDFKLIRANEDNPRGLEPLELYNIQEDPSEQNNLARSPSTAQILEELEGRLDTFRQEGSASALKAVRAEHGADAEEQLRALGYISDDDQD